MEPMEGREFIENEDLPIEWEEDHGMPLFELALRSRQKINNTMAASISNRVMGIRNATIRDSLASFDHVSHRLETVATVRGVVYINDSKATNINSVWFSLESMESSVVLILGGNQSEKDYHVIKELVDEKVNTIICIGEENEAIHKVLSPDVEMWLDVTSLKDAVHAAYMLAEKGEVVLFSPACPSFGQFKNYEDRGTQFAEAVRDL